MGGGHSWGERGGRVKAGEREGGRRVELGREKGGGSKLKRGERERERERKGVSKLGREGRGDHRWEREGDHSKGERGEAGS